MIARKRESSSSVKSAAERAARERSSGEICRRSAARPCAVCVGREVRDLGDGAVAEVADELAGELLRAVAGVEQAAEDGEDVGGVVGVDGFEDLLEDGVGDGAHELADFVGGERGHAAFDEALRRWPGP